MSELHLRITLETDIVLSATAATVGGHRTLQRIRGSVLLGACAAQGYDDPNSFDLFHSGRVRYGDALPEAEAGVAWPMPLVLHKDKTVNDPTQPLWNLAVAERPSNAQMVQERVGFIDAGGRRVPVATAYSMRTAVDELGRARDGFLYGLESVAAGQSFRSVVTSSDPDLLAGVERRLVGRSHRLGRSRTAEFGLARIERVDPVPASEWPLVAGSAKVVRLWCLSDVALRDDDSGAPRLQPTGADFGLPDDVHPRLDPARSFLRFARWSPFNGKRGRPDLERQVIVAGSVVVFALDRPIDLSVPRAAAADGIGAYRHEGLGRVVVQPAFLESERVTVSSPVAVHEADPADVPADGVATVADAAPLPQDDLGAWLGAQLREAAEQDRVWATSRTWSESMKKYADVPAAQWGEVRRLAAMARLQGADPAKFRENLERKLGLKAAREGDASKGRRMGRGTTAKRWAERHDGRSAAECLVGLLASAEAADVLPATELLAARMARLKREEPRDG